MKIVRICAVALVLSFSLSVYAEDEGGFVDRLITTVRPYVVQVLGEETANSWFGAEPTLELPEIPAVKKEATSTATLPEDPNRNLIPKKKINAYSMRYLKDVYRSVLLREPNRNDIGKWMNVLLQGGTREGVYRGIVLDGAYTSLEEVGPQTSDRCAKYAASFMEKYLNKKIALNKIKSVGFYTVKRNVVEKTLEVADQFLKEGRIEDFFNWYSIISADIAKENENIWQRKLRANTDPYVHQEWTQVVPRQMVKSELVIKLHSLMNYLNGGA